MSDYSNSEIPKGLYYADVAVLAKIFAERYGTSVDAAYEWLTKDIEVPSADVQPVVRCRDCIYSKMTTDGSCKYCEYLANEFDVIDAVYFCGNDFCSHGKRKGADNVSDK